MTRPLRIIYPGAIYHITVRGNRKQDIFLGDKDRDIFLQTLASVIKTYRWICHAYCLMNNHYHLIIETPEENLSSGMRDLNGIYTQTLNRKHHLTGHVFQGRFKAFVIEKESYLLEVSRYVVLNPVRSGLVASPEKWLWSNFCFTAGLKKAPAWLTTQWTLEYFSSQLSKAHKMYQIFVLEGLGKEKPKRKKGDGIVFGSPQFVHEVWRITKNISNKKEVSRCERIIGRPSLEEIFEDIRGIEERNDAIRFARLCCGYQGSIIAKFLHLSPTTVSLIARGKKKSPKQKNNKKIKGGKG